MTGDWRVFMRAESKNREIQTEREREKHEIVKTEKNWSLTVGSGGTVRDSWQDHHTSSPLMSGD